MSKYARHDNSNKNARKGDLSESDKQQAPNTNGTTTSSLSSGSVSSYKSRAPSEEYGEFLHLPGQRFYDFSEIFNGNPESDWIY